MTDELDRKDALAAEYVLGTLNTYERAEARALMDMDARFAADVRSWERRLNPLGATGPDQRPPRSLWRAVERALPAPDQVEPAPGVSAWRRELDTLTSILRWRLVIWRGVAVAATAALVAVIALPFVSPQVLRKAGLQPDRYVALLRGDSGGDAFLVTVDVSTNMLYIRPLDSPPPRGKSYQLWLVKSGAASPKSMGLLPGRKGAVKPMQEPMGRDAFAKGNKLAVSLEPMGGSPTGLPTGPVMFAGQILRQLP